MSETGLLVSLALAVALGVPAWLLERASVRRPADRAWLGPLALGATAELLARTAPLVRDATGWAYLDGIGRGLALAVPPLLLVGLVLAVRQRMSGVRVNVLIDGLAGALAGTCVAALVLAPLADRLWDGSWQSGLDLARPLLSSALSAAAVGALSLLGTDHLARFGAWVAGTTLLAGADILTAAFPAEGPWAGVFPLLALGLVAAGAHVSTAEQELRLPGPRSLGVPATAAAVAVATLAIAPPWSLTPTPSVLALVTLAVSTVRFVRVFLQLRELAAIREQALTDELTGIANRRALYLHLDRLLNPEDDGAAGAPEFAVALIDLDHFKEVNDTLGHATGDALLKGVVGRFAAALEELETPHLLARLGGDEFAVVLHEASSRNAALIVGEALAESLAEPLELPDTSLHAQASIGLAAAPLHGRTRGELLFAADAAMYAAKSSGDAVRFHAPKADEKTQQLGVAEDLYLALERHELFVEYQPMRTVGGELVGVEALVRWQHPERGRLEPGDFLEAAERYRLTGAIAERVLDIALRDVACWRAEGVPLNLTVNLSAADLRDDSVVSTIAHALLAHRLPAKVLTLDLDEAGLAADLDRVRDVVTALHELGVRLALDDYGTGGTSLTALMGLPLHSIKIDRRFVRDAAINPRLGGIVRASVDLVHSLGLRVVAEGVEDRNVLELLLQLGCDLVQGWHVGRPTDAAGIEQLLAQPTGGKHRQAPHVPTVPGQPAAGVPRPVPATPAHPSERPSSSVDGLTSSPS